MVNSSSQLDSVDYRDRLLAESVRAAEEMRGEPFENALADESGRAIDGDFERRIIERARALPAASDLNRAVHRVDQLMTWLIAGAAILALLTGIGAARAALGAGQDRPVLIVPALIGLLGLQTFLLLLHLAMLFIHPRGLPGGSLGGLVLRVAARIAQWGTHNREYLAALQSYLTVSLRQPIARWKISAISHAMWSAFNIGCIAALLVLLSTRYYTFGWETTILPSDAFAPLIKSVAWLPAKLGFLTPTAEQISDSQWSGGGDQYHLSDIDQARQAWAGLLVGAMVVYGLAPRLLLAAISMIGLRRGQNHYRLDTTLPGYIRLRPVLLPAAESIGIIDADDTIEDTIPGGTRTPSSQRPVGDAIAIVGIDLDEPKTGWPPAIPGTKLLDLGRIVDRAGRNRAIEKLRTFEQSPRTLAVVCALTTTPDRGIVSILQQLQDAARSPITLILTGGQTLRQRGAPHQMDVRIQDWRALANAIEMDGEHVIEIDLDHATDASLRRLADRLGNKTIVGAANAPPSRRLESAFAIIESHAQQWSAAPDAKQQVKLHAAIAELYRAERQSLFKSMTFDTRTAANILSQVKDGAKSTFALMPARLRNTPKWAVAGAAAGALGCLAVATLVTPAALAVIPTWSVVGGAISGAMHAVHKFSPSKDSAQSIDNTTVTSETDDAIRAAAMFAVLLDLQGRDETTISRVLERTFVDESDSTSPGDSRPQWLDELRHNYDMALAMESGVSP